MIPNFNKVEFQHGENTRILRLRLKMMSAGREDVRGRGLPGLGIGRGRPRTANFKFS